MKSPPGMASASKATRMYLYGLCKNCHEPKPNRSRAGHAALA